MLRRFPFCRPWRSTESVEDNYLFHKVWQRERTSYAQSGVTVWTKFIYLFSFASSLVLDDHSMLSSCQTWHSVSINIARSCIVFHYKFFLPLNKNCLTQEFHCFYIAFLSNSCSKTMIQLTATILLFPIYTTFSILLRVIRKLSNIFHVYIRLVQNLAFIFYLHIFLLFALTLHILLKLIFVFIYIKKNVKYRKVNIN